ncbi:hypothetical protein TNCV_192501 [Trichonephila clavipes]|nr:hypothetical protein TNCV_192501 [Trichonephila clavipes]
MLSVCSQEGRVNFLRLHSIESNTRRDPILDENDDSKIISEDAEIIIVFIYLSNARAWHLDHLTPSLPVPTDESHWIRWSPSILEWTQGSALSRCLGIGFTVARFSHGFTRLLGF